MGSMPKFQRRGQQDGSAAEALFTHQPEFSPQNPSKGGAENQVHKAGSDLHICINHNVHTHTHHTNNNNNNNVEVVVVG